MDDFDDYGIEMESELISHDIDEVDNNNINEEDNSDDRFNDIDFDLNK